MEIQTPLAILARVCGSPRGSVKHRLKNHCFRPLCMKGQILVCAEKWFLVGGTLSIPIQASYLNNSCSTGHLQEEPWRDMIGVKHVGMCFACLCAQVHYLCSHPEIFPAVGKNHLHIVAGAATCERTSSRRLS